MLKKIKVDCLYIPKEDQIYPNGVNKKIKIISFGKELCGKFRPGHFEAIADVIDRFVELIKPKKIYLGEKDMQQLKIIEHFIKKNHKKTKVVGCKTVREKNGLAYSSRNLLLTMKQKKIASRIYKVLVHKKKDLIRKRFSIALMKKKILEMGVNKIDYISVLDINKITKTFTRKKRNKVFIAYYLNSIRLIDNI